MLQEEFLKRYTAPSEVQVPNGFGRNSSETCCFLALVVNQMVEGHAQYWKRWQTPGQTRPPTVCAAVRALRGGKDELYGVPARERDVPLYPMR